MTETHAAPFGLLPNGDPIMWRVLDPDGNVVQAGGQSVAEMTADLAESLGITEGE